MRLERLYDVQWRVVKQATMGWLKQLDDIKIRNPAQVVTAVAVLFLLTCERFGLRPSEVLTVADRVVRRATDVDPQYPRAVREYLREELSDG